MKKGPPPDFVRDRNGNVVNGLRKQKSKTKGGREIVRYFTVPADGGRKYFGNSDDKPGAIFAYRQWQAQQEGHTLGVTTGKATLREFDDDPEAVFRRPIEITIDKDGSVEVADHVQEDAFWAVVASEIHSNAQLVAQKTKIEQIGYLHRLEPPPPSKSLEEIGRLYLDDKVDEITPKEWKNSETWWKEFCDITGAKFVADLDRQQFRRYMKIIKQRRGGRSPVWIRSRFSKIKTIIHHALDEMDLTADEQKILKIVSLLKPPPKPTPDPDVITPQDLKMILKVADDWMTALILTALNCAYGATDCCRLERNMIDGRQGTIRFDRTKAVGRAKGSVPRVAVLWKRTHKALKKIDRELRHVFALAHGRPPHVETIRRYWDDLLQEAGIDRDLSFGVLRRSTQTAAASSKNPAVPYQQYQVLSGHTFKGVEDNYIRRNPRLVELACEAVERYYFGRISM